MPPHTHASTAASTSASASTIIASLPVLVEPVNASLSTPERHSAEPTSPVPCTTWSTGCSGTTSANTSTSHWPTAGVYSLGLKTTALPAASAYPIEPSGVSTG